MNKKLQDKIERLLPGGIPRWVRCYDSKEDGDRYTVVFTATKDGVCHYVGMSGAPFHPQGICQHGEHDRMIDRPRYRHLGKRITFSDLPKPCQRVVLSDYCELHNIPLDTPEIAEAIKALPTY